MTGTSGTSMQTLTRLDYIRNWRANNVERCREHKKRYAAFIRKINTVHLQDEKLVFEGLKDFAHQRWEWMGPDPMFHPVPVGD